MLASRTSTRELVRRVTNLPDGFMVRRVSDTWVVAGPTGIFVVGRAGRDVGESARRTVAMAHRLRELLSETMPWVPFVDALLVGRKPDPTVECTMVQPDMLESVLTTGASNLDLAGLHQVRLQLPRLAQELQASFAPREATA